MPCRRTSIASMRSSQAASRSRERRLSCSKARPCAAFTSGTNPALEWLPRYARESGPAEVAATRGYLRTSEADGQPDIENRKRLKALQFVFQARLLGGSLALQRRALRSAEAGAIGVERGLR